MEFSVRISPRQAQRGHNGDLKTVAEKSVSSEAPDGRNMPLKLAQLLNSESEDLELKISTRASSVGVESSSQLPDGETESVPVNTAPGKSIMKISYEQTSNDQHGLMTPESLENMSPLGLTALNEENELNQCLEFDARKSTLLSKHLHLSWNEIKKEALARLQPDGFTKGETDLIVHEWFSPGPIDFRRLEEECFSRSGKAIQALVANLSVHYSDLIEPNLRIISTLETCLARQEYMKSDVLKYLSEDSIANMCALLPKRLPMRPRWLTREVHFMTTCIENRMAEEEIRSELVFRTPSQVRYKIAALTKKILKTNPDFLVEERTHDPEHDGLIERLLENDLTKSGIYNECGKTLGNKIIQSLNSIIEKKGGSHQVPFSKAELDYLRNIIRSEYSVQEIQNELIFRSEDEIQDKLNSLQIICVRQKKFSNRNERLMYEAQWYASLAGSSQGRRRRGREDDGNRESSPHVDDGRKRRQNNIDEERRRDIIERAAMKRRETLRLKREARERRLEAQQARVKARTVLMKSKRQLRSQERPKTPVDSLLADASWFQSITGDGTTVQQGQKRARKQAVHFVPEFESRQKMKLVKKKMEERKLEKKRLLRKRKHEKKRKLKLRPGRRGRGRPKAEDYTDDSESGSESESESEESETTPEIDVADVSDEEDEPSPFDPINVLNDTQVPTKGRQCFNDAITAISTEPDTISFSPDTLMLDPEAQVPLIDTTAIDVIVSHSRNYKSLPKSFPPFTIQKDGNTIINPRNIVRVRYLLYPEHSDAYILALPKSNELNPVYEIQKMMQIQSALYFAHSPELQTHIYEEYCQKLKACAENDKFYQFMVIIDRWNLLMLELTPYRLRIDPSFDINNEIRYYLPFNYRKNHSVVDLNLNKFFFDVVNNGKPKPPRGRKPKKAREVKQDGRLSNQNETGGDLASNMQNGSTDTDILKSRYHNTRPAEYPESFLRILAYQKDISRFAVQQILTTAYTRIVGPNSRKLRSYKAFTAEVYGELLPSFISEVLTKVGLQPTHLFYDLGSGVGNTTFQAALEFGVKESGGCEIMSHASMLTNLQHLFLQRKIQALGLNPMNLSFALSQSFVNNEEVREKCLRCNVVLVNNYLFEFPLNVEVGKLLYGLKPGSKIISLKNFIPPRYKAGPEKTVLDYLKVEKFEMSDFFSVSWTANKVPYYISTVMKEVRPEYL